MSCETEPLQNESHLNVMKTSISILSLGCLMLSATLLHAQNGRQPKTTPPPAPAPPPVSAAQPVPASSESFVYEQKPVGGRAPLVTPEQAQTIINRFKEAYPKMGSPRILLYVNRELVDEESGLKLSARSEQIESVRGDAKLRVDDKSAANRQATNGGSTQAATTVPGNSDRVTAKNTYRIRDRKQPVLADRQTTRDVEQLFGRPLRLGGASLVDQQTATQLLPGKPLDHFLARTEGEQARKDREALAKVADVVLEILISSRNVNVSEISGDKVYAVPDIQATAIRLSDAKILGQATASDLIGHDHSAGRAARSFGVRDITEATALSLMEDMLQ
jgi:hypothetical protein